MCTFILPLFLKRSIMKHQPLDIYEEMPPAMRNYILNYGWNFNRKACEYAVKQMKRLDESTHEEKPITPWSKEKVEELLTTHGIKLKNDVMYNSTYVCNMGVADYLRSAVPDESYLALYIKNTIDDVDGCSELPFRFWLQKCVALGTPIEWEDII